MSTERGSNANKINNTFDRVMGDINKFEQVFKQGGSLEQAVMDVDGDPSHLKDVSLALSNLYEALEDAHYGTMGHITGDMPTETLSKKKKISPKTPVDMVAEGVLDGDDDDGFMARSQLYFLARDAITLHGAIDDRDDLQPWVQSKIAQASKDIDAVRRYTEYNAVDAENSMPQSHAEEIPMVADEPEMEESTINEIDHAREYVRVNAPERMLGMEPAAKNAFLADLEKTYPGMRKDLGEGTWAVPENEADVKVLTDLMQNPIPVGDDGDNAADVMYGVLGDDELFDEFVEMAATLGPEADARPAIENRLKELGIMEGMNFNEKRTDDLQVVAKDLFKNALANAKKKSKTATVKEDKLNEFGLIAPIAANLAVKGAEKLYKKYTDNKSSKKQAGKAAPAATAPAATASPAAEPSKPSPAPKKPAVKKAKSRVPEGNYPEPRKMQVTDADKLGQTPAWKRFKAGDPAYEYKKLKPKTISGDN